MALTEDDRKEIVASLADGVAAGLAKFRSMAEEEEAKKRQNAPKEEPKNEPSNNRGDSFGLAGFILGN